MPCIFCDQTPDTVEAVEMLNAIVKALHLPNTLTIDPATGQSSTKIISAISTAPKIILGHVQHLIQRANYAEMNEERAKKNLKVAIDTIQNLRAEILSLKNQRVAPSPFIDPETPGLREYEIQRQRGQNPWGRPKKDAWVHTRWDGLKARQKKW